MHFAGSEAGSSPASVFRQVWCCDFEFQLDGGLQVPLCMVARETITGQEIRLWRDDLLTLAQAPFDVSEDCLMVAYTATAELHCFIALGWPLPAHLLDLCQEHKQAINYGRFAKEKIGWGLVDALRVRGLQHLMAAEKADMIDLILGNRDYTAAERQSILDYCAIDVIALSDLLSAMWPSLDLPRAIGFRGRYMKAAARMEHAGVPFDVETYTDLVTYLPAIKADLIAETDRDIGVYSSGVFKHARFEQFLVDEGLDWERTVSGRLKLDDDYLKQRADTHPKIRALHELRGALNLMSNITQSRANPRVRRMAPSSDGLARCQLWPFGAATGRNTPRAREFIFGPARWLRGLIKPAPGYAVAYIDWSQQEFAIVAGLSGDQNMLHAYASGDVYMALAEAVGMVPPGSDAADYPEQRAVCKIIILGMSYGSGWRSIARNANLPAEVAHQAYAGHKRQFATFWAWTDAVVHSAEMHRVISTRFGWQQLVNHATEQLTLMNFPAQATGAHAMQIAAIAATEAGLRVCCPVHDAFLISAPVDQIDADIAAMREIMRKAGRAVCGVDIRTDVDKVVWPNRYSDKRGAKMWDSIMTLLARHKSHLHAKNTSPQSQQMELAA
jgi:DNA polymerase-1